MIGDRLLSEPFVALGTTCSVAATVSRGRSELARRALAAARTEIAHCESVLSRFRSASDLCRLNRHAGTWVHVDERLLSALASSVRLREETKGRFDPTILPALIAAGYDASFEQLRPRPPSAGPQRRAGAAIDLDLVAGCARIEADAAIDLGGIGKGFAAERALWAMQERWPGLPGAVVDLGGDVVVWGVPPDGDLWRIAVADPRDQASTLLQLELAQGAVATSGRDTRRFGPGGTLHHLIDPDSGAPAHAGPFAVTVVAADAKHAEAYATAVAVSEMGLATSILAARPSLSALVVPAVGDPFVIGRLPISTKPAPTEVLT